MHLKEETHIDLKAGEYLYRFLVDVWRINLNEPIKMNDDGEEFNVLIVQKA